MAIRPCVTISLVPEARGGPFVFWDNLAEGCRKARALGFEAVEIFAPSAESLNEAEVRRLLEGSGLRLAALGTGGGWVKQRLTLCSGDAEVRRRAREFIRAFVERAAAFSASAIIGSMQGRWGDGASRDEAMGWLSEGLEELGEHARQCGNAPLLYEPLNRYETNLVNTVADGVQMVQSLSTKHVRLLCDLFHMNMEERDIAGALRSGGRHVGHIHFVDSNRRPAGCGHIDYAPIVSALEDIRFDGYLSAEALPYPDPDGAARMTMQSFRQLFCHS